MYLNRPKTTDTDCFKDKFINSRKQQHTHKILRRRRGKMRKIFISRAAPPQTHIVHQGWQPCWRRRPVRLLPSWPQRAMHASCCAGTRRTKWTRTTRRRLRAGWGRRKFGIGVAPRWMSGCLRQERCWPPAMLPRPQTRASV